MSRLKIAIVGTGSRAQDHLATISMLPDLYLLVGVADARDDRRQQVSAQYGVPGFRTASELLATTEPNVLLIAVPPDGHHPIAVLAAQHGVHVVTEVPIAPTRAMANVMIRASEQYGVRLAVAENVWRWPTEALKRRAVEAGVIGDITQIHLWYGSGSYHGMSVVHQLMPTQPIRALGLARTVRTPERLDLMNRPQQYQPYELGVIEYADGATAIYQQPIHLERQNYWEVVGTRGYLAGGSLVLERDRIRQPIERVTELVNGVERLVALRFKDTDIVWENPLREYPFSRDDEIARAAVLVDMYHSVLESKPAAYGGARAWQDQEVLIALRESGRRGSTWVDLPLDEMTEFEAEWHRDYVATYGADPFDGYEALASSDFPRQGVSQFLLDKKKG